MTLACATAYPSVIWPAAGYSTNHARSSYQSNSLHVEPGILAGSILLLLLDVETMQHPVEDWRKHEARGDDNHEP